MDGLHIDVENKSNIASSASRCSTLNTLRVTTFPNYINPVPSDATLRIWLDKAGVPRLKTNPHAKRGGGPCFYSVAAVEKMLSQLLPGRLSSPSIGGVR